MISKVVPLFLNVLICCSVVKPAPLISMLASCYIILYSILTPFLFVLVPCSVSLEMVMKQKEWNENKIAT